jgi:hypothetical protein
VLDADLASAFARVALANVQREYPRRLDQLLTAADAEWRPRALHPAFFGSYDWHSAVHMHWLLARLLRLFPALEDRIAPVLDRHLTPGSIAAELAFFRSPGGATFERPYGWAWLLELQAELIRLPRRGWRDALQPLAAELAERFGGFIDASPYPMRAGSHANTAFACLLALDYARRAADADLESRIGNAARRWYGTDRAAPLAYEPSLDDFLSPSLIEAVLMQQVLPEEEFRPWREAFLPADLGPLAHPPVIPDRTDPKQCHLDGLALSRAWCLRRLGDVVAAERQLAAALPHVVGGNYVGEHWLASFAALAPGESP